MPVEAGTPLATVRGCLEQFRYTVGIARNLVQAGKLVDLAGLDAQIGFVCARALDLPREEGRALRPALIEIRDDLDALSAALDRERMPSPA